MKKINVQRGGYNGPFKKAARAFRDGLRRRGKDGKSKKLHLEVYLKQNLKQQSRRINWFDPLYLNMPAVAAGDEGAGASRSSSSKK